MSGLLVSVIIPCYNSEKFISRAIDSVINQKYETLEMILVDDGSTDGTKTILDKYALDNSSWIKIIQQENKGACAARNAGLKIANGDYIQFLDADDNLLPDKIKFQIGLVKTFDHPELIAGSYIRYGKKKEVVEMQKMDSWVALIIGRLGSTCSNLFSRKLLN